MLPTKRNPVYEEVAKRNEQINGQHAPYKHGTDSQHDGGPILQEFTHMNFEANQKKHERIHEE